MKQIHITHSKKLLFILLIPVILGTGMSVFSLTRPEPSAQTTNTSEVVRPQFTFDEQAAPDWRQGPANETSMALFHKQTDCFVSFESKSEPANEATEIQKKRADLTANRYTVTVIATPAVTLQQAATKTNYVLHQLSVVGSGSPNDVYKSQEFGYAPSDNGHVFVQGYCKNPADLPGTIAALSAVTFTPSK